MAEWWPGGAEKPPCELAKNAIFLLVLGLRPRLVFSQSSGLTPTTLAATAGQDRVRVQRHSRDVARQPLVADGTAARPAGRAGSSGRPVTHPYRDGLVNPHPRPIDRTTSWPILIVGSLQT